MPVRLKTRLGMGGGVFQCSRGLHLERNLDTMEQRSTPEHQREARMEED